MEKLYPIWKSKLATRLKKRRLKLINNLVFNGNLFDNDWLRGKKVLDLGCANGKDFLQFFFSYQETHLYGLDINHYDYDSTKCKFLQCDASNIPFEDDFFDIVVSFGVLEHIGPIEKLCSVISEIDRVAKSYAIIVPSISTILEPHTARFLWQLRARNKKSNYPHLYYYSDETWLQFSGFHGAETKRFCYIPPVISNIVIYRPYSG